jgi:hypothetical protein
VAVFTKKETAPTSHENSTIHRTNLHSTILVREHPQYIYISTIQVHEHYKTQENTENTEENKINVLPGNEPGHSSLQLVAT